MESESSVKVKGNIEHLAELFRGPMDVRSLALIGLFVLAVFHTLAIAQDLFLPIVLALLLNFLLAPMVRALHRIRIPYPIGAATILLAGLGGVGVVAYNLSTPLSE